MSRKFLYAFTGFIAALLIIPLLGWLRTQIQLAPCNAAFNGAGCGWGGLFGLVLYMTLPTIVGVPLAAIYCYILAEGVEAPIADGNTNIGNSPGTLTDTRSKTNLWEVLSSLISLVICYLLVSIIPNLGLSVGAQYVYFTILILLGALGLWIPLVVIPKFHKWWGINRRRFWIVSLLLLVLCIAVSCFFIIF